MPDFDKLKEHVHKLDMLLADQQPGLGTWCMFVGETWKEIAEMWRPQSAGGPPTGDLASQPDSTPENPGRLVPIWVREYVEWKIDQRLGDKPPLTSLADSEIPERGEWQPSKLDAQRIQFAMNFTTAACLRAYSRTITEQKMQGFEAAAYLAQSADTIEAGQPAGGPPTLDLAAQPDSNKKDPDSLGSPVPPASKSALREADRSKCIGCVLPDRIYLTCPVHGFLWSPKVSAVTGDWPAQQVGGPPIKDLAADLDSNTDPLPAIPIGVHDYDSLVACLKTNYQLVFPGEDWVDPQNMIQLMAAHIQELRRRLEGIRAV